MATTYPTPDLSVDAVADEFAVERKTILALIHAGELEAFDARRPGARRALYRITRAALDDFRERRAYRGRAPQPERRVRRPMLAPGDKVFV